jgi:hypothetical protein
MRYFRQNANELSKRKWIERNWRRPRTIDGSFHFLNYLIQINRVIINLRELLEFLKQWDSETRAVFFINQLLHRRRSRFTILTRSIIIRERNTTNTWLTCRSFFNLSNVYRPIMINAKTSQRQKKIDIRGVNRSMNGCKEIPRSMFCNIVCWQN